MTGDERMAALGGAFRIAREATIDGLLGVIRAYPSSRVPADSAAVLRRRAQGIVVALESQLGADELLTPLAVEMGSTLFGITDGSDQALVSIVGYLSDRFERVIPADALPDSRPRLLDITRFVMVGWLQRRDQDAGQVEAWAEAMGERVRAGLDGDIVRRAVEQSPLGILLIDLADGSPLVYNAAVTRLFGFSLEEELAVTPEQGQNEDSADDDFDMLADMLAGRIPYMERVSARPHKDGHSVPFHLLAWPVRDEHGAITHLANQLSPIEPRTPGTAGSGLAEKRARYLLQISPDPVAIVSVDGIVRYASPSVASSTGVDPDWLVGKSIGVLLAEEAMDAGFRLLESARANPRSRLVEELAVRMHDGSSRWFEVIATNLLDVDDVQGIVLQGRDVTVRRDLQASLERMARTEALTGLLNRRGFLDDLERRLAQRLERRAAGDEASAEAALIYVDLDDFKTINDRYGHLAGDAVLVRVARRLEALVDGAGIAGRMGGDEFVLFVEHADTVAQADFMDHLADALQGTVLVGEAEIAYSASFGSVAVIPGADAGGLLHAADVHLNFAKQTRSRSPLRAPDRR